MLTLVAALALGASPSSPDAGARLDLPAVLKKLGEDARAREDGGTCGYREITTVEELGADGGVLGAEVRTFDVEVKGTEVTRRDPVSVVPSGAPLADLLQQQRNTKGKKPARSPLHPDAQPEYSFALADGPGPEQQTVTIEPLKPNVERPRGVAVVNARTHRLEELRFSPSKVPLLLKSLAMRFQMDDTACGRQPVLIEVQGEGVAVFVETKFRTRTVLDRHARPAR